MPYAFDPFLDEEKKNQQDGMDSGGPQLAGGSQIVGGGTQTTSAGGSAKGPTSSERFTNLNSYLDANQGNQFGENFAQKVQGDVSKGQEAQEQAGGTFKSQADNATIAANPALVNSAVSDPTKFAADANNVTEFKKQKDAQYQGPNTFADSADLYSKTYGATKKATDVAEAAQSEPGRFALLNQYFGRPEYSQGQKSLDNLLVSGDEKAQDGLAQARTNAQSLAQNFDTTNKNLSEYAAKARGTTEATRTGARDALGIDNAGNVVSGKGAIGGVTSELDKRIADYQGNVDKISGLVGQGKWSEISPELKELFDGLGGSYGVNATPFLQTTDKGAINQASVASADEQAKLRALASLADIQNPIDVPGAGSLYDDKGYKFDTEGFKGKVANEKQAFQAQNTQMQAALEQAKNSAKFFQDSINRNGPDTGLQNGVNDSMRLKEQQEKIKEIQSKLGQLYSQYGLSYAGETVGGGGGIAGIGGGVR